jgi:hypothetical protein
MPRRLLGDDDTDEIGISNVLVEIEVVDFMKS